MAGRSGVWSRFAYQNWEVEAGGEDTNLGPAMAWFRAKIWATEEKLPGKTYTANLIEPAGGSGMYFYSPIDDVVDVTRPSKVSNIKCSKILGNSDKRLTFWIFIRYIYKCVRDFEMVKLPVLILSTTSTCWTRRKTNLTNQPNWTYNEGWSLVELMLSQSITL